MTTVPLGKTDPVTIPDPAHWLVAQVLGAGLLAGAILGLTSAHLLVDRDHRVERAGATVVADTPLPASLAGHPGVGPRSALAGAYRAHLVKVVDGDTVEVRVHVWLGQEVITRVRLLGIDAPEIAGACGPERIQAVAARDRLAALMGDGPVTLVDLRPDKYFGRVVGRVLTGAGDDAGAMLVREGLARPYSGGRRQGWCALPG
jgi:endonuclease YncB( thermonuclease family)